VIGARGIGGHSSGTLNPHYTRHDRPHDGRGTGIFNLGRGPGYRDGHRYNQDWQRRFARCYSRPYYRRYLDYRRCYMPLRPYFARAYYPSYYGLYDYYAYYPSRFSIFASAYRPATQTTYEFDTVYVSTPAENDNPPVSQTYYYTEPAQQVATPTPDVRDIVSPEAAQERPSSWVELGGTAFTAGEYDEARRLYMRAVLADDEDGYAQLFYGLASFAGGEYGAAATAFRRALEAAPELIDDPIDLRSFYADESTLTGQLAALGEVLAGQPGDREARFLLGYLHFATGNPEEALGVLQPVASSGPVDTLAVLVRDAATRVLSVREETP